MDYFEQNVVAGESKLSVEALRLLIVRQNCVMRREGFYDNELKDRDLPHDINSSEIYSWHDHCKIQPTFKST